MLNTVIAPIVNRLAALASGLLGAARRPQAAPALDTPLVHRIPVERLSIETQWARVAGVVTGAVATVESVRTTQTAAGQQIDSAAYALQGLIAELASVMSVPAAPQPESIVLRLEQQPAPMPRRELAA